MEVFFKDLLHNIETYYKSLVRVTPKILVAFIVVVLIWFLAARLKLFADKRLKKRLHDPLLATFLANLLKALLIVAGIFLMFRIIGLTSLASSVLAGAGISAFVIGFALKDIGENFLAGILLAFKRPFTVGDIIETNGVKGKVISLNLRDTQVKSDGRDIFIPNALLIKNTLVNYNRGGYLLQDFTIGLEYGSDYRAAIAIAKKIINDQDEIELDGYQNIVVISGVIGTAALLNVRYWVKTDNMIADGRIRSEVLIKTLEQLKSSGFVIKKE